MRHVSGTARENTKELVTKPSPSQEYLSRDLAVVQDPEVLLDLHFVLGSPIDGHHCGGGDQYIGKWRLEVEMEGQHFYKGQ